MKRFNTAAVCVPKMHYMVDISEKIREIRQYVDRGDYFTINRARQYGKTTTRMYLEKDLENDYIVINTSFEGIGDAIFETEKSFTGQLFNLLANAVRFNNRNFAEELESYGKEINNFSELSNKITEFCLSKNKKIVLIIDEVDKSCNNQLFLSFLGMLRDKYIQQNMGKDCTFHSVILLGVYNIKNLKLKLRPEEEKKYNSPWNVAVDFDVDMSFSVEEIKTMLDDYETFNHTNMNKDKIATLLRYYTRGYPFLVSKLCKIVDEKLNKKWNEEGIEEAVKILVNEENTLFDDLVKNLENNSELYKTVYDQLIMGREFSFNVHNPLINLGAMFGIFRNRNGIRKIDNRIFEQVIYNYMTSKLEQKENPGSYNFRDNFITGTGDLDIKKILDKYQQYIKEEYSSKDEEFIEREGRLLFLVFLRPIINGRGFALKEVQISEEHRLDILITYNRKKYVIELKKWYGQEYYKKGIRQLEDYLNKQNLNEGYLIVYNFNRNKEYSNRWLTKEESQKRIYEIVV